MILVPVEQGSDAWVRARLGVVTASGAAKILTPAKLAPSAQAQEYRDELNGEWLTGGPVDIFHGTGWTDRGHVMEPAARDAVRLATGLEVTPGGFVYRDQARTAGCSPDGLCRAHGDIVAGLELKCPAPHTHIGYRRSLAAGVVPTQYRMQVQFSLWVTGLKRWLFASYHPDAGCALTEVTPDQATQDALDEHMPAFLEALEAERADLLAEGIRPRETAVEEEVVW